MSSPSGVCRWGMPRILPVSQREKGDLGKTTCGHCARLWLCPLSYSDHSEALLMLAG